MATSTRPATLADAAAVSDLRRVIAPYQVFNAVGVHHWWETTPPQAKLRVDVVEDDGRVVAVGWSSLNTWTSQAGVGSVYVMVEPGHRGRGLGSALFADLERHLVDHGVTQVQAWAEVTSDDWCARRGFTRTHELRFSRLELAGLSPAPAPGPGVRVVSWAEAGPEATFAVDSIASRDEPGDVPLDAIPYDDWLRDIFTAPTTDVDVSTVVFVGDVPAALTLVETDYPTGRVWSGSTGTIPSLRGRGLAKLAKWVALRAAAAAGATAAYTCNDEVNQPMLAVNVGLGYRPCATQFAYLKSL